MDFPAAWTILPAEEYALAAPRIDGDLTLELMAQVRHTGRILDHFRMACGGSKPLEVDVDFGAMLPMPAFKGWRLQAQFWPRDLLLRQNTFSSAWIDTVATIGMREVTILDQHGAIIPCTEVLRILDRPEDEDDDPALRGDGIIEQNIRRRKERERQQRERASRRQQHRVTVV